MRPPAPIDEVIHPLEEVTRVCLDCGDCLNECSLLEDLGLKPAQLAQQVLEDRVSQEALHLIQRCSLCGLCCTDCPVDVPLAMMAARALLLETGRISLEDYQTFLVDQDWHFFTLYRDTYEIDYRDLGRDAYETLFFPGCTLASYAPELTHAAYAWLKDQGELMGLSDQCCGLLLSSIGLKDRAAQHVARLRQQISAAGARKLVTACPGCHHHLKARLQGVEVVSLYEMMAQSGLRLTGDLRLTVHDSCPDRSEDIIGRQVRRLLAGYSLVEMRHHGRHTICCGSGGLVSAVDPKLCTERSCARMEEFTASGADRCVTACMGCANRLSRAARAGSIVHCLELIFNQCVDHTDVQAKARAMWEGEWGEYNLYRLAHAKPVPAIANR